MLKINSPRLQRLVPYGLIVLASITANWFVQLGYYLYMVHRNPLAFRGARTLLDYTTGYVGDLVLVPLLNVTILYILLRLRPTFTKVHYLVLLGSGLLADA